MKKLILTALISLIIGLGAIQANGVVPPRHPKAREVRHDKHIVNKDKKRLHHNVKEGNTVKAKHNARKLHRDKRKLNHDRKAH